ncbi:MAG: carbohydrate kinase family protein [Anaerolineae bacterium]
MALRQFDIVIPGNYFCDIIFSGLPKFPELGTEIYTEAVTVVPGGVVNTIVALHRLNVNVGWIGTLGNDFFSRFVRDQVEQEQIDTSLLIQRDSSLKRVTVALSEPRDRAFISYVDPAPDTVGMLLEAWSEVNCGHLHFTRLMHDERLLPLLRDCRQRGIFVSMDCQHRTETIDLPLVQATLSLVDAFMPNASEALRITGATDVDAAARTLRRFVPLVVIKDGAGGAQAWHDGTHYHDPALPDMQVVDTTGAGDVFNAGFLAAHIAGSDLPACLRWGNICGGLSTQGYGGCTSAPTLAELKARLA